MTWKRIAPASRVHDYAHDKARKQWAAKHQPSDPCARCGHPLGPMGRWLHLDHHDHDKTRYLGFSHGDKPCPICKRKCNTDAGGARGRQTQKLRAQRRRGSVIVKRRRDWYG